MRWQTKELIKDVIAKHGPFPKVLEVGSLDVNGNLKEFFEEGYWGVDMREGANVDQVVNGHDLVSTFGENQFDLVICVDTMEHDDKFWLTMENLKGVVKPGGWVVVGVPSRHCPEHDHPHDYWRFMPQGVAELMSGLEDVSLEVQRDDPSLAEDEIYAYGRKT